MSDPNKFVAGAYGPLLDVRRVACITCARRRTETTCEAFPEAIPDPLLDGEHDHRTPYPGDNGLTYVPRPL